MNSNTQQLENGGEMTLEKLALMVAEGFRGMDERFEQMDQKFVKLFTNLQRETNNGFIKVEERFNRLENLVVHDHGKRIEKVEGDVKELKEMFAI